MTKLYGIIETFEILGRGVVVVIDQIVPVVNGKEVPVIIHTSGGQTFVANAYHEWFLRKSMIKLEQSAFLLKNLKKHNIPAGSQIQFQFVE
jgi:hypothetical protein